MNTPQQEVKLNPQRIHQEVCWGLTQAFELSSQAEGVFIVWFSLGMQNAWVGAKTTSQLPTEQGEKASHKEEVTPSAGLETCTGFVQQDRQDWSQSSLQSSPRGWAHLSEVNYFPSPRVHRLYCYLSAVSHMPSESLRTDFDFLSLNHSHIFNCL